MSAPSYVDPSSGDVWDYQSLEAGKWQEAADYCAKLIGCGKDGWTLPTVDMLRSLIRGCPATQAGGACELTQSCLLTSCSNGCAVCPRAAGPANGRYLPEPLSAISASLWSSSLPPDDPNGAWALDVLTGSLFKQSRGSNGGIACVHRK